MNQSERYANEFEYLIITVISSCGSYPSHNMVWSVKIGKATNKVNTNNNNNVLKNEFKVTGWELLNK